MNTLEEKLAASKKTSRNSSKPPSSDIVKSKKPKTSEHEGKRKAGGQSGHPKHTRLLYTKDQITGFHHHVHACCPDCGSEVELRLDLEPRRVQQIEIEKMPVLKEEHNSYAFTKHILSSVKTRFPRNSRKTWAHTARSPSSRIRF